MSAGHYAKRDVAPRSTVHGASKYLAERLSGEIALAAVRELRLPVARGGCPSRLEPKIVEWVGSSEHVTIYDPQSMFNNAAHVCDLNNFYMKLVKGHWSGSPFRSARQGNS